MAALFFYHSPNHTVFVIKSTIRGVDNPLEYGQNAPCNCWVDITFTYKYTIETVKCLILFVNNLTGIMPVHGLMPRVPQIVTAPMAILEKTGES